MQLENKIAAITGGSAGIGRGIAEAFLREGASVAIMARNAGKAEQMLTELNAALPVPVKIKPRAHQHGMLSNKRQPTALEHVVRTFLPVTLYQLRLIRKQVELRWRADHVQVNHVLRARLEMRLPGCHGAGRDGRRKQAGSDDGTQSQCADAKPGVFQEFPPAFREVILLPWIHPLVMVSSRFIKILVR